MPSPSSSSSSSSSRTGCLGLLLGSTRQLGQLMFLLTLILQTVIIVRLYQGDQFRTTESRRNSLATLSMAAASTAAEEEQDDDGTGIQLDIMVPVYQRDDRLIQFAVDYGKAIVEYRRKLKATEDHVSRFRLLVTRFSNRERTNAAKTQRLLADLTNLPLQNIVMVQHASSTQKFSRATALNLLHAAACHEERCLVSRVDVDMMIRADFFHHAVEILVQRQYPADDPGDAEWRVTDPDIDKNYPPAYFPIVWSQYDPLSVSLVEEASKHLSNKPATLTRYSEHRGHWRHYGKGMYVLLGPDAAILKFDESYQGWGLEDTDFYNRTVALPRRIVRRLEPGLTHVWHWKACNLGADIMTEEQKEKCKSSNTQQEGSKYGIELKKMFYKALDRREKEIAQFKQKEAKFEAARKDAQMRERFANTDDMTGFPDIQKW